jgi:hydrogenase nickel incorporation protein HypB
MCENCGCADTHDHSHDHDHPHDHTHEHNKIVTLEQKVLSHNEEMAEKNRAFFAENGIVTVNILSSPGSGKTYLLEKTLEAFNGVILCAVITGDLQTDNDADRLAGKGAPVKQIQTGSACHLDAAQIADSLKEVVDAGTKILFIENVGNLVCPSAFNLGEHFKIALLSVTEGEDKPLKYPSLFSQAPVTVVTKTDLVPHLDCDMQVLRDNLRTVHPGVFIFELSAKSGEGMEAWLDYLRNLV